MLPNFLPVGTSVESFFEQVLPEAHRALVPADASAGEHTLSVRIDGGPSYRYSVRGRDLAVTPGDGPAHLCIALEQASVGFFLEDLMGPRRFAPSFVPAQGVKLITDPRILKRLAQASGSIELRLVDDGKSASGALPFDAATLRISAAGAKKHEAKTAAADAVVETQVTVFERLLEGKLGPDEAIAGGHVTVRGKKLVAMQFAFAIAPFFPAKP